MRCQGCQHELETLFSFVDPAAFIPVLEPVLDPVPWNPYVTFGPYVLLSRMRGRGAMAFSYRKVHKSQTHLQKITSVEGK